MFGRLYSLNEYSIQTIDNNLYFFHDKQSIKKYMKDDDVLWIDGRLKIIEPYFSTKNVSLVKDEDIIKIKVELEIWNENMTDHSHDDLWFNGSQELMNWYNENFEHSDNGYDYISKNTRIIGINEIIKMPLKMRK